MNMILFLLTNVLMVLNVIAIITIIFYEHKDPASTYAWIVVLVFLPGIGLILYLLFGHNYIRRKRLQFSENSTQAVRTLVEQQLKAFSIIEEGPSSDLNYLRLMQMNLVRDFSLLTDDNTINVFTNGKQKFPALIEDIKNASHYIHMDYFIFRDDQIGHEIIELLAEKAAAGLDIKVVFDDIGNVGISNSRFGKLKQAGGKVYRYSPVFTSIFSTNYRNHKKLAIIDGIIGYIGGMNIGDEYADAHKYCTPWRDTHLRIEGSAVMLMEVLFLEDFVYAANKKDKQLDMQKYFNFNHQFQGDKAVQIVSSTPKPGLDHIRLAYLKMINTAERYVYIQTPYLCPDKSFTDAITMAVNSGVDVRIMIPRRPDKVFVNLATLNFSRDFEEMGVKIYIYDGFLHAKTIVVDDKVSTVGSANMDIRSFTLSFEANAFIYNHKFALAMKDLFLTDMQSSFMADAAYFKSLPKIKRFCMPVFKLLSPLF